LFLFVVHFRLVFFSLIGWGVSGDTVGFEMTPCDFGLGVWVRVEPSLMCVGSLPGVAEVSLLLSCAYFKRDIDAFESLKQQSVRGILLSRGLLSRSW
jgi:hypothetical protein